jgi:hypothetical protein
VSVEALRRQDADADSDIAKVLQQNVGDQMDMAIEELAQCQRAFNFPQLWALKIPHPLVS